MLRHNNVAVSAAHPHSLQNDESFGPAESVITQPGARAGSSDVRARVCVCVCTCSPLVVYTMKVLLRKWAGVSAAPPSSSTRQEQLNGSIWAKRFSLWRRDGVCIIRANDTSLSPTIFLFSPPPPACSVTAYHDLSGPFFPLATIWLASTQKTMLMLF